MCCWCYERLSKLCMMLSFMKENNFANPVLCIISVGEFNHFGHPSAHVITELQKKDGIVFMVTDAASSMVIQTASLPMPG